jgi:hypothetical protein
MGNQLYVGVGCVEAQYVPFAVLRYSIEKHATCPTVVQPLFRAGIHVPVPRDPRNRQKTPFSFQRFVIPEVRGFEGRAMYLDSDMLVFDDIALLFQLDFGTANILAVPQETSVLVLDCARLSWRVRELVSQLDEGTLSYDGLMSCRSIAQVSYSLPRTWNWLDNSPAPMPAHVSLLHFTVTSSQPWLTGGHPLGHLWLGALFEAIDAGVIDRAEVLEAVGRGFVRPSLLFQIDHRVLTKKDLPAEVLKDDEPFAAYCRSVHYAVVDGFKH